MFMIVTTVFVLNKPQWVIKTFRNFRALPPFLYMKKLEEKKEPHYSFRNNKAGLNVSLTKRTLTPSSPIVGYYGPYYY